MRHWLLLLFICCFTAPAMAASFEFEKTATSTTTVNESQAIVRLNERITVNPGQTVNGDVVSIGGPVDVKGTVNGNAVSIGSNVTLFPTGKVNGDAVAIGGQVAKRGGTLIGSETSLGPKVHWRHEPDWLWRVLRAIGMIALLTLIAAIFPKPMERLSFAAEHAPLASFLWGLGALLAFVPLAVLLAISLVGILLIPVEALVYLAAWIFGFAGICTLIGQRLLQGKRALILATLLGAFVVQLVGLVPILGWLVQLVIVIFGFGAILLSRFGTREATTIQ